LNPLCAPKKPDSSFLCPSHSRDGGAAECRRSSRATRRSAHTGSRPQQKQNESEMEQRMYSVPGESGKDFSGWSALQAASVRMSSWLLGWRESRSSKFDRDPVRGTNGGASRDAIVERRGEEHMAFTFASSRFFLSADTKTWRRPGDDR
jgi:hypothetical protein